MAQIVEGSDHSRAMLGASDLLQDVATGSSVRATATLQLGTTVSTKGQGDTTLYSIAKSPINPKNLCLELEGNDKEKAAAIRNGFTFGFQLHYSGPHMPSDAKNLKSALEQPGVVRQEIQAEIEKGRVAGPFIKRPIKTLRVSPIGLVPKKEPNQFRLIHHLSYPPGNSFNDFIEPKLYSPHI